MTPLLLVVLALLLWPGSRTPPVLWPGSRTPPRLRRRAGTTAHLSRPAVRRLAGASAARWLLAREHHGRGYRTGWVADFAEVVAIGLDAGLSLDGACDVAGSTGSVARSAPWVGECLASARVRGTGVAEALAASAHPPGGPARHMSRQDDEDLLVLLAAWRLSEHLGTATASVTAAAAREVRDRGAARDRLDVAASGPRTSMVLLSCLPLLGPVGGAMAGIGPTRLYSGPAGVAAVVVGGVLTLLGWCWASRLLARATRPALTSGGSFGGGRAAKRWAGRGSSDG